MKLAHELWSLQAREPWFLVQHLRCKQKDLGAWRCLSRSPEESTWWTSTSVWLGCSAGDEVFQKSTIQHFQLVPVIAKGTNMYQYMIRLLIHTQIREAITDQSQASRFRSTRNVRLDVDHKNTNRWPCRGLSRTLAMICSEEVEAPRNQLIHELWTELYFSD